MVKNNTVFRSIRGNVIRVTGFTLDYSQAVVEITYLIEEGVYSRKEIAIMDTSKLIEKVRNNEWVKCDEAVHLQKEKISMKPHLFVSVEL